MAWVMFAPPIGISRLKQLTPPRITLIEVVFAPTSTSAVARVSSASWPSASGSAQSSQAFATAKRSRSIAIGVRPAAVTMLAWPSRRACGHAATSTFISPAAA